MKMIKTELNDFQAKFLISMIPQIPKIARIVNSTTESASKIEMARLNILLYFIQN